MGLLTDILEEVSGNSFDEGALASYEETIVETVQDNFAEALGYGTLASLQKKTGHQILYGSTVDFPELISAIKDLSK